MIVSPPGITLSGLQVAEFARPSWTIRRSDMNFARTEEYARVHALNDDCTVSDHTHEPDCTPLI